MYSLLESVQSENIDIEEEVYITGDVSDWR